MKERGERRWRVRIGAGDVIGVFGTYRRNTVIVTDLLEAFDIVRKELGTFDGPASELFKKVAEAL